ncbi:hypothetical protein QBC40DRAFT_225982 [Triangularia verruculosa]|uniref:Uncharacterized protein n=1 Tax=Triangularia verruculosa TaxID=2587418 RepID=A0AAN6XHH9_9PEZI|nr:hypothetical protein QBC40DRAFT_225982 [Triangularia verruculosa]
MSGRGRGRGRAASSADAGVGRARRSTRQAQQQQQEGEPSAVPPNQAPTHQEAVDPAISVQDGIMGPPPPPGVKNAPVQSVYQFSRRGAPRGERGASTASLNSVAVSDSAYTAYTSQPDNLIANTLPGPSQGTPMRPVSVPVRASSVPFSIAYETPGKRAVKARFMVQKLVALKEAAGELFDHLCNDREIDGWDVALEQLHSLYEAYRRFYVGKNSEPTIDPSFVLEATEVREGTPSWYKAYRTVYLANLVSLYKDIQTTDPADYLPLLQSWDEEFPKFYVPRDQTIKGVSEMVIDIRTQLSIFTLKALRQHGSPNFHPYEKLARIWCVGDLSADNVTAALGGNKDDLQLKLVDPEDPESAENLERAWTRFNSLCGQLTDKYFTPGDENTFDHALHELETTYGFPEFLHNLRKLVELYFHHTNQALDMAEMPAPVQTADMSARTDSQIQTQLESEAMAQGPPSSSYNIGYPAPLTNYPRVPYPEFSQESSPGFADPTQRNGFQNGAIYAQSAAQATTTTGRKRRGQAASDVNGDQANPQPKKRARRKKNADAEADPSPNGQIVPAQPLVPTQYPPLPGTQMEPDFDALTQRSKEISAANRKVREPQVRSAWVRNDVRELVKAVHTYGCKWSVIEKQIKEGNIHFERPRDQQALRDKARLLKQDFLKADGILPKGFDLVVLGKKEREAVKACGKNPDRKEADLDANGAVINTELGDAVAAAAHAAPVAQMEALPAPPLHDPQLQLQGAEVLGMDGAQEGFPDHDKSEPEPEAAHDPALDASVEPPPVVSDLDQIAAA